MALRRCDTKKMSFAGLIGLCLIGLCHGKYTYETKYINVPLDHFSFFNNHTLKLRYLINDKFWKPSDGPIFFYAGNEGDIDVFAQNTGFLWEAAEKFYALVVFAEHRYYGKSLPCKGHSHSNSNGTQNNQFEYFTYLSSPQVLADYVDVINDVKTHKKHGGRQVGKQSNPVIAFGGSLGGMLAAWMRMKYPAVIEGALASSAPIFYFSGMTPCDGYNKVLTRVFNDTSPKCVENIKKSWKVIRENAKEGNYSDSWINKNWNLCKPVESEENVSRLIDVVSEVYSAVGMVNYPYPNDFLMPVPANPVKEMCKYLNSSFKDDKSLLSAVHKSISVYLNYNGKSKCLNWTSDPFGDIDMVAWGVQSCSEMVMPFCSNGVTDMFEPYSWNYTTFEKECKDYYGVTSKEKFVENEYGGKDLRYTSNIIFSNGLLDPWSSGGVTPSKNIPSSVVLVDIPESAHHLDLRAKHPKDPPSVEKARKLYVNIFRRWIRNYRKRNAST